MPKTAADDDDDPFTYLSTIFPNKFTQPKKQQQKSKSEPSSVCWDEGSEFGLLQYLHKTFPVSKLSSSSSPLCSPEVGPFGQQNLCGHIFQRGEAIYRCR
jgi:hypothetical protein